MPHEIRFASFNVLNLALPHSRFYENQPPYSIAQYDAKISWLAAQLDRLDADVIGLQEIFSQAALTDVLARTRNYRDAHQIGFDPRDDVFPLTPSVALISRLPLAGAPQSHARLPRGLSVVLPGMTEPMTHFTRPILQADLCLPRRGRLSVFVAHLKSKRPDWLSERSFEGDPAELAEANLRSLIRRGTEALGLRYLVTDQRLAGSQPIAVLADFNDIATAVTTQLITGGTWRDGIGSDQRLFDSVQIQTQPEHGAQAYTHQHDGMSETIDHIFLSEEFNAASPRAIGEVLQVRYLNEHLALRPEAASDHGQVLVRVALHDTAPR
ncbi:MAG: endonuclease/exonuclease/phosphatase family protein [Pseudomonadota bacterium]|nr:endonuclease/exonuclease/phosphatase family protein [Pseudomonadota bacterium]